MTFGTMTPFATRSCPSGRDRFGQMTDPKRHGEADVGIRAPEQGNRTPPSEFARTVAFDLLRLAAELDEAERETGNLSQMDREALLAVHRLAKSDALFRDIRSLIDKHLGVRADLVRLTRVAKLIPDIVAVVKELRSAGLDPKARNDQLKERVPEVCESSEVSLDDRTLERLVTAAFIDIDRGLTDRIRELLGGRTRLLNLQSLLDDEAPDGTSIEDGAIKTDKDAHSVMCAEPLHERFVVDYVLRHAALPPGAGQALRRVLDEHCDRRFREIPRHIPDRDAR